MTSINPRRSMLATLAALLAVMALSIEVGAASPVDNGTPILIGDYGVHTLIDDLEPYAAVACEYSGSNLHKMRIRRPIAFADGSPQDIAWEYQIEGSNDGLAWTKVYKSSKEKRYAAQKQPAPFERRTYTFGTLTYNYYRSIIRTFWYRNGQIDGKIFRAPEWYEEYGGTGTFQSFCPSGTTSSSSAGIRSAASAPLLGPLEPPDPDTKYVTGDYGLNILIDEGGPGFWAGAACTYSGSMLSSIRIRRPIAFPSGHQQYVGWQYRIDGTNDTSDLVNATWNVVATGTLQKVLTTPPQVAAFTSKTYQFSSWPYLAYRAVAMVFWYDPSNTIAGRSYMAVEIYDDSVTINQFENACLMTHP